MKRITLLAALMITSLLSKEQIIKIATSPTVIATQIPGYSEVTSITTKTFSYTPSVIPPTPTPIDDDSTTENDRIYYYGDILPVSISVADGNLTTTSVGKIWTLRISISSALNIGLTFNQFDLSSIAEMYVFNDARTVLDSAIKNENFSASSVVSISSIKGSSLIIYIVEPNNFGTFQSAFSIEKLVAGYQEVDEVGDTGSGQYTPQSIDCDPMIQCQPSKIVFGRSVARMVTQVTSTKMGFCTGTLINNESNNGRAYFLTAFHCIDFNKNNIIDQSEIDLLAASAFQFRFWRTQCDGNTNNRYIEFLGATLKASWKNSDVVLLELINSPGIGDGVNYAGWNRQSSAPPDYSSFIIHHPETQDMRITTVSNVHTRFWDNDFWTAHYSSGTVTPGSSGSALMNGYAQIIGQLKAGWSSCTFPDFGDYYGKFDRSWTGGGTNNSRLSNWLSPNQNLQGVAFLNLTDIPINGPDLIACTTPSQYSTFPGLLDVTYSWTVSAGLQIIRIL